MSTTACHALIDAAYSKFLASLPSHLLRLARNLPAHLQLSPIADVPWSMVFNNIAVLGFPALLFGETSRAVDPELTRCALRAHMFAMIAAFAEDRITDGQIDAGRELVELIEAIAAERDGALAQLAARGGVAEVDYDEARELTESAAADEQAMFGDAIPARVDHYREVSRGKQALAFPASLAAARAAGFDAEDLRRVEALLLGCTLGLQYRDDVVDWLDDHRGRGAWAVLLLDTPAGTLDALERQLDEQRVLVDMLEMSRDEFASAARAARELGASSLARWAAGQAAITHELAVREADEPGHALAWERDRVARRTAAQAVQQAA